MRFQGKRRTDHKLYFPQDLIDQLSSKRKVKDQIINLLKGDQS